MGTRAWGQAWAPVQDCVSPPPTSCKAAAAGQFPTGVRHWHHCWILTFQKIVQIEQISKFQDNMCCASWVSVRHVSALRSVLVLSLLFLWLVCSRISQSSNTTHAFSFQSPDQFAPSVSHCNQYGWGYCRTLNSHTSPHAILARN